MLRAISGVAGLLLDRGSDGRGDLRHLVDDLADALDGIHRFLGRALDGGDLRGDAFGGARRLRRKALDLGGDDGKALAGFARARGFDGRVQRQKVGLRRDAC